MSGNTRKGVNKKTRTAGLAHSGTIVNDLGAPGEKGALGRCTRARTRTRAATSSSIVCYSCVRKKKGKQEERKAMCL